MPKVNPITGLEELTQEDLLMQNPSANSNITSQDSLANLEDIGYEDPTQDQMNDAGYKAAAAYLKNSSPVPAKTQAEILAEYQSLNRKPTVTGPDGQEVLGNDLLAKQDAQINQEVEQAAQEFDKPDDSSSEMPPIESLLSAEDSVSPLKKRESLLEEYKRLVQNKQDNNRTLDLLTGGNQIAQAIAFGYGGKIGDGSEAVNQLRKSTDLPVEAYLGRTKALEVENEVQMNDPDSDISKFARENAIAYARKAGLDENTVEQLQDLSAKQLEKLGFKAQVSTARARVIDKNIVNPANNKVESVLFDEQGNVIKNLGEAGYSYSTNIDPVTKLPRMISKSNPNATPINIPGSTPTVKPTDAASVTQQTPTADQATPVAETKQQEPEEYKSPTSLSKINVKLYDKFTESKKELLKDMKDSREVATSTTNLSAKLTAGDNTGKIDSGLLGGIQTQAAKMAGQKGVLTDQDLVKFAGAGGVAAAIDRITSGSMFGEMSTQDVQFFKAFAKKMNSSLEQDIENRSKFFVEDVHLEAKDYLPGLSQDSVKNWLGVQNVAPAVQKDMVKVISPDGKAGAIPRENLEKALKKGYKEVN